MSEDKSLPDDITPELQESNLFTKVDVKNAFCHVRLVNALVHRSVGRAETHITPGIIT